MKRGTIEHPKTETFAKLLGINLAQAVGHLEALWHFAAKYAPQGDIGRFEKPIIASRCLWEGDPDKFIDALSNARWIDRCDRHRLIVHDWHQHADRSVQTKLKRDGLEIIKCAHNARTVCAPDGAQDAHSVREKVRLPEPVPEPEPEPQTGGEASPPTDEPDRLTEYERSSGVRLPRNLNDPTFRDLFNDWLATLRDAPTAKGVNMQLARLAQMGKDRAIAATRYSIAQGYKGIVEEKRNPRDPPPDANAREVLIPEDRLLD